MKGFFRRRGGAKETPLRRDGVAALAALAAVAVRRSAMVRKGGDRNWLNHRTIKSSGFVFGILMIFLFISDDLIDLNLAGIQQHGVMFSRCVALKVGGSISSKAAFLGHDGCGYPESS